jgi:hypothetical protein
MLDNIRVVHGDNSIVNDEISSQFYLLLILRTTKVLYRVNPLRK